MAVTSIKFCVEGTDITIVWLCTEVGLCTLGLCTEVGLCTMGVYRGAGLCTDGGVVYRGGVMY